MAVNTLLSGLSQSAASNGPDGTTDAPSTIDDAIRYSLSFIASLRDGKGFAAPIALASGATTDIGAQNAQTVEITGTTTITSFGVNYNGPRFLRFTGALTLTHNATTLNLPGGANILTRAGDTCVAIPNTAGNGWNIHSFQTNGSEAALLLANGYQRFASGLILQWGSSVVTLNSGGEGTANFPLAFPNSALFVLPQNGDMSVTGNATLGGTTTVLNQTGFSFAVRPNPGAINVRVNFVAVGT